MRTSPFEYFIGTCAKKPDEIAIVDGERRVSFRELEVTVKRLLATLIDGKARRNSVIGVYLNKSTDLVAADLAIGGASCSYMNLDRNSPIERTKAIISVSEPSLIITDEYGRKKLTTAGVRIDVLAIEEIASRICDVGLEFDDLVLLKPVERVIDTDPHCVIATSGSTGIPKSVVLNHRGFFDFIDWAFNCEICFPSDIVIGSLSPAVFDIFSFEILMLAVKGATLVLIDEGLSAFPVMILERLQEYNVSFIFWVPTIMVNIANLDLLRNRRLDALELIWFAGEVMPAPAFNYWFDALPKRMFVNLYGPIEITLDCTYHIAKEKLKPAELLPIGKACKNKEVFVIADTGDLAKDGEIGEICVRGSGLAMGYINNPLKTAESFVQNPFNNRYPDIVYKTGDLGAVKDGLIWFKGRADTMIKHQGYRIELGEVEAALINCSNLIRNACVIYNPEEKRILAIVESDSALIIDAIKSKIATLLPRYMCPREYFHVDRMPMNTNGKIDRLSLKKRYINA